MSSKSVILKRKAAAGDSAARTGSSHSPFARKKSAYSSPLTKQSSTNINFQGTPKVDLDKENNNSVVKKSTSTTPRSAAKNLSEKPKVHSSVATVTLREPHKRMHSQESNLPSKKVAEKSGSIVTRNAGTVCAAVALASSTTAMARRHRRSVSCDRFQHSPKSEPGRTARHTKRSEINSPVRTQGQSGPMQKSPPKRKLMPETDIYSKGSPSMKSIPSNMVRKMIKNIQVGRKFLILSLHSLFRQHIAKGAFSDFELIILK